MVLGIMALFLFFAWTAWAGGCDHFIEEEIKNTKLEAGWALLFLSSIFACISGGIEIGKSLNVIRDVQYGGHEQLQHNDENGGDHSLPGSSM
eukprot:jgi/Bigna1/60464/fgenesh1_kg.12_\